MVDPKEHIYMVEGNEKIIVYREADNPNTKQVVNFFSYVQELAGGEQFHMILNLSKAKPPSSEVRHEFKKGFSQLRPFVKSFSIYFGRNFLLKITAKFVGASIGLEDYISINSIEERISELKNR